MRRRVLLPVQFFSLFQFSKSVHRAVYDYQILEAVYFRSTDVSRMSKRVYYADRTLGNGKFLRNYYANPCFVSDRTGIDFYHSRYPRSAFHVWVSLRLRNINFVLYCMYSVLLRASSRPLTPTNRRGRKVSETFFYPYAIFSMRGFLLRLLEDCALAGSGTPRNTHFLSSLDMGHRGP